MNKYAAFLRGINVGGHHLVKMEELRRRLTALGLENVVTYIQSGNVIFETTENDAGALDRKIEQTLFDWLGFEVKVMLRTIPELVDAARRNPFTESAEVKVYITFLAAAPDENAVRAVESLGGELESFRISDRELYSSLDRSVKKSLFTGNFTEKHLKLSGTTRNIRTIEKMISLGSAD